MNDFLIGVCDAMPLDSIGNAPFVSKDIQKRINPQAIMQNAKSIIVVAVPYQKNIIDTQSGAGVVSSLAVNNDYHKIVKNVLYNIAIEQDIKNYKILVDSPYLDEKAFAQMAGIGYYGRNGLIITEKYGTKCNLGLLITDKYIMPATQNINHCPIYCRLCINACPTSAISDNGFNYKICISYLTQKAELTPKEEKLINNNLYGCDICQNACPKNKSEIYYADPEKWFILSDSEWQELYGHTAILWQGSKILKRNAKVVINNLTHKKQI